MNLQTYAIVANLTLAVIPFAHAAEPITLKPGPHLLVDDYLIAKSDGVERRVVQAKRFLDKPVVTSGPEHRNWQPWFTVLQDATLPASQRFRMWYGADADANNADDEHKTAFGYLESADGIHWPGPYRSLGEIDSMLFGACVLDGGPKAPQPDERYKLMYYRSPREYGPPTDNAHNAVAVAFSPDGLRWKMHNGGESVVKLPSPGADSWQATYDPLRQRYLLIGKTNQIHEWTNAEGVPLKKRIRMYGTSFSQDFKTWGDFSDILFKPDSKDPGVTEWYAITGFQVRGDLLIGFLQLLRDDLTPEGAPQAAIDCNRGRAGSGMGYTVLCWTRDGETWHRDRQSDALLSPNPEVGTWDHAMAWVGSAVPVGDELYLYYGGYRWGHKYQRSLDRQIGLAKLKRDRYVARHAGPAGGTLTTPLVKLAGDQLTLNVDAADGEIRVEVLDAAGQPILGFTRADCQPITTDSLSIPVAWKDKSLADLKDQAVQLRFTLKNASLFAFEIQ